MKIGIEKLFYNKKKVGENILWFIKDNGYTKYSFAKMVNISRPTLDKLISGNINSLTTFKTHIQKILSTFNLTEDQLLNYIPKRVDNKGITFAFSNNSPEGHTFNSRAQKMFEILEDIIHLCEIYYNNEVGA